MQPNLPTRRPRAGRPRLRSDDAAARNRTLLRGVDLLSRFGALGVPATLSEIARLAGMSPSRTQRYLEALLEAEFVRYDGDTGTFRLGTAALQLGMAAIAQIAPLDLCSSALREVTEATHLASHLCVWGSGGTTVIRWEAGTLETAMRIREGQVLGVFTTSSGRIFLTYLTAESTPFLAEDLAKWNASVPAAQRIDATAVDAIRAAIRRDGLAHAVGMRNPAIAALSAPIFSRDGLVMSMTVSGIRGSFDDGLGGLPAKTLLEVSTRITRSLGGNVGRGADR